MFKRRNKPEQPEDYDMTIKLLVNTIVILNGLASESDSILDTADKVKLNEIVHQLKHITECAQTRRGWF